MQRNLFIYIRNLLLLPVVLCCYSTIPAQKDDRTVTGRSACTQTTGVALVIGNADYKNAAKLKSPVNDAAAVGSTLQKLGFCVLPIRKDASLQDMENAVAEFGRELKESKGVGVFYYSGHGIQSSGSNYLIPTEASVPSRSFLKYKTLNLEAVLQTMDEATRGLKIVILDACRNNPFAKEWGTKGSTERGLAVQYAPKGMLIAYATSPNDTAADGDVGRNSPYTEVLLREIIKPKVTLIEMFNEVGNVLNEATNGGQTPWISSSPVGKFCFAGCEKGSTTISALKRGDPETRENIKLIPYRKGDKWGFSDSNKNIVISPRFDEVERFNGPNFELANATVNGKTGLIDRRGREVVSFVYDHVHDFPNKLGTELFEVKQNDRVGIIDKNGKTWIPIEYERISPQENADVIVAQKKGKFGLLDRYGKNLTTFIYEEIGRFEEDLAAAKLSGKWGVINSRGQIILPFKFDAYDEDFLDIAPFVAGASLNGKWGFFDKRNGNTVIPFVYDQFDWASDRLAGAVRGGRAGVIDIKGAIIIPFTYDAVAQFEGNIAWVELNGKFGYIDIAGKAVTPIKYDSPEFFLESDLVLLMTQGKKMLVDKTGEEISFAYDMFGRFSEGLAEICITEQRCGFIDKTAKEVIPLKYEYEKNKAGHLISIFNEGLAPVMLNGKVGYIDKTGKVVIPLRYDHALYFYDGLGRVWRGDVYFYVGRDGTEYYEP